MAKSFYQSRGVQISSRTNFDVADFKKQIEKITMTSNLQEIIINFRDKSRELTKWFPDFLKALGN